MYAVAHVCPSPITHMWCTIVSRILKRGWSLGFWDKSITVLLLLPYMLTVKLGESLWAQIWTLLIPGWPVSACSYWVLHLSCGALVVTCHAVILCTSSENDKNILNKTLNFGFQAWLLYKWSLNSPIRLSCSKFLIVQLIKRTKLGLPISEHAHLLEGEWAEVPVHALAPSPGHLCVYLLDNNDIKFYDITVPFWHDTQALIVCMLELSQGQNEIISQHFTGWIIIMPFSKMHEGCYALPCRVNDEKGEVLAMVKGSDLSASLR